MNTSDKLKEYLKHKEVEIKSCKKIKCQEVVEEINSIYKDRALRYNANTKEKLYIICDNAYAYESFSEVCFGVKATSIFVNGGQIKTEIIKLPMFTLMSKYIDVDKQELRQFISDNTIDYIKEFNL